MRLSKEYQRFDSEIKVSVPYLASPVNALRLGITSAQVASIQAHLVAWNSKFALYKSPQTHTDPTIIDVQQLYAVFHSEIQGIKRQLKHNQSIKLTGDDYLAIGLHQNAQKRYRIPRPLIAPFNAVTKQHHLVCQIFTSNSDPEHNTEKCLPVDVHKIGRKMVIQSADAAAPEFDAYRALESVGNTMYNLIFDEADIGCRAWLITCYINARGEEGPYSHPVSFLII